MDICTKIQEFLDDIEEGKGTAEDVEKIRNLLLEYDEYEHWGDDR